MQNQNHPDPLLRHHAIDAETKADVAPVDGIKQRAYACPDCHGAVVFCKGQVLHPYFRHARDPGNACARYTRETEEHFVAKHLVCDAVRDRVVSVRRICKGCDQPFSVVINDHEGETRVYTEYGFQHEGRQRYADVAITTVADRKKDEVLLAVLEICKTHPTQDDARPEPFYEFAASAVIETMQPILGTKDPVTFDCIRNLDSSKDGYGYAYCNDCILSPKEKDDTPIPTPTPFLRQQGAGNGKTYGCVQLLNHANWIQFTRGCGVVQALQKKHMFFLTKMHSAVRATVDEIQQQLNDGVLGSGVYLTKRRDGKQTTFEIVFPGIGIVTATAGTIDSFNYALQDPNTEYFGQNMFANIMRDLALDRMVDIRTKRPRYAGAPLPLSSDVLVFVDEAQDLEVEQLTAFQNIQERSKVDIVFVGDLLQSVNCSENIISFLLKNSDKALTDPAFLQNVVLRFRRKKFQDLVNGTVDFAKHGLLPISGIAADADTLDDDAIDTVNALTLLEDFAEAYDKNESDTFETSAENILTWMELLVDEKGYSPSKFWIIVPVAQGNAFASYLEGAITDFWIRKFSDPKTYENEAFVENLRKEGGDRYWASKLDAREHDKEAYLYCKFHRAELNKPIDLRESHFATRITTIHTSKGGGREAVAVLQMSETILIKLARHHRDWELVFDSLWLVSITRCKRHLLLGLTATECASKGELFRRLYGVEGLIDATKTVSCLHEEVRAMRLVPAPLKVEELANQCFLDGGKGLERLHSDYKTVSVDKNTKTASVDWGHHLVRKAGLDAIAHGFLLEHLPPREQQLRAMLYGVRNALLKPVKTYAEYTKGLSQLYKKVKKNIENNYESKQDEAIVCQSDSKTKTHEDEEKRGLEIPICTYADQDNGFHEIAKLFFEYCQRVQAKVKSALESSASSPLSLCPIESVVYRFLVTITQNPYRASPSMFEVYNILLHFKKVYNPTRYPMHQHSDRFGCICDSIVPVANNDEDVESSPMHLSITNHYMSTKRLPHVMQRYTDLLWQLSGSESELFSYRIDKEIFCGQPKNVQISYRGPFEWVAVSPDERVVVATKICPQWTSMNAPQHLTEFWYVHVMLAIEHHEDTRIYFVVIHLDADEPSLIDYNKRYASDRVAAKDELKQRFLQQYGPYHAIVADYVLHTLATKLEKKQILEYICEKLDTQSRTKKDNELSFVKLPTYVLQAFRTLDGQIHTFSKERKKVIGQGLRQKEWLVAHLDETLELQIDRLLHITNELEGDDDDMLY